MSELVLLLEAPIQDAKNLRDVFNDAEVAVTLVRPENCGRKA